MSATSRVAGRALLQRIVWMLAGLACVIVFIDGFAQRWSAARTITLSRDSGWAALAFLLAALCVTPMSRLLALRGSPIASRLSPFRRAFGISSAVFALWHAGYAFFVFLRAQTSLFDWAHLQAGLLALIVLSFLLLTSFPLLVTRLHVRTWKELHRLAYVAALLALLHVLLSPFASRAWVLYLYGAVFVFGLARWLPKPSPDKGIDQSADQTSSGMPDSRQNSSSTPE